LAIILFVTTYLDNILAFHRQRALEEKKYVSLKDLAAKAYDYNQLHGSPRNLLFALRPPETKSTSIPRLIAEIKKHSPSKGDLRNDLDPVSVATDYEVGGAAAISVLTDEPHFKGHLSYLESVKKTVSIPILRKDFLVCKEDIFTSRLNDADAVLLIVAALSNEELKEMHDTAKSLFMNTLIEIHDEHELERALAVGPDIVGINQRDLHTFTIDTNRAIRLRELIGNQIITVAESGINSFEDLKTLGQAGFDAVLVGENLVIQDDHLSAVKKLLGTIDKA